jgi:hypothetical protein
VKVEEARAAVQASGELEGIEGPLFLADATSLATWLPYYIGGVTGDHPVAARVTVTRRGQSPRDVVIVWDEYADELENDPEWNATRDRKPTAVFGGECERHAYRVVFADILAPLLAAETPAPQTGDPWAPLGDGSRESMFLADLVFATTEADVDEVWTNARGHRTAGLERACRDRKAEIRAAANESAAGSLPPVEAAVMQSPAARGPRAESGPGPTPHPPAPGIPRLVDPVKSVSRKAQSRGARDSGRRGGGQR